jgi:subtilisin family serine protease
MQHFIVIELFEFFMQKLKKNKDQKNINLKRLLALSLLPLSFNVFADDVGIYANPLPYYGTSTELKNSWQVGKINAPYLWGYGVSGASVKIGEIDTGISMHNELQGRVLAGYNFVRNKAIAANTSSDDNGHGTHVAGIIAANVGTNFGTYDVVGVAPQASLIPIKVLDNRGSGSLANVVNGIDYSWKQGAHISSMSLGWSGSGDSTVQAALNRAVTAGQLLVIAAGNDGALNPGWPARYAKDSFANGQIIAVGAVDNNNNMPSWSNKAGDTANFYLVAPGVNILSTYNSSASSYATMSGTSMATPVVSGAAALLKQGWNLSAKQIANILFTTATDLGVTGVDSTYGWGLLNLQKAMSPIGNPTFPTVTSKGITITTTSIVSSASQTPTAYKAAIANANLKVAGLDDFGRDFIYDFSSLYGANKEVKDQTLSQIMSSMNTNLSVREYKTKDSKMALAQIDTNINMASNSMDAFGNSLNKETTVTSFFYSKDLFDKQSFAVGMNTNTNRFFGFADTPFEYSGFIARKAFDNPYLGFESSQNFLAYSAPLGDHWRVGAGLLNNSDSIARQSTSVSGEYRSYQPNLNASLIELSNTQENNKFALSFGSVTEQTGMLGGSAGSLFGITESSNTMFISLKNATKLTKDTWFAASLNNGITLKNGNQNSLVSSTSNINSQSWSVGLLSDNVIQKNDRIGLAISQPLAVTSGNMNLDLPVGLDYDSGVMKFQTTSISMSSPTTERDFELSYRMPTTENSNLALSALYRMNPENNAMNSDQKVLTVFWRNWF